MPLLRFVMARMLCAPVRAVNPMLFRYHRRAMIDLLFGNGYEVLLTMIALIAAIPYGIYVGLKKLGTKLFGGKANGDSRTG